MTTRFLAVAAAATLAILAVPAFAGAAAFKVTAAGSQQLSWSLNGTRGTCGSWQATGSGSTDFKFKSSKASYLNVSKKGIVGSVLVNASGNQTGSFTEINTAPCGNSTLDDPFVAESSGCGAFTTVPRFDFNTKGAFTYLAGPVQSLNTTGPCPHYIDNSLAKSSDFSACGDSSSQYKRSWGVGSSTSRGLLASKLHLSMKKLLKVKKGKKKTITGKASVDCSVASDYSDPIKIKAELKYSFVFKRIL